MLIEDELKTLTGYAPLVDNYNDVYLPHQYRQLGGYDVGYPRIKAQSIVWSLIFDLGQRRFYLQASNGISHNLLTVPDNIQVTQVTFTFDLSYNIVWAYSYINTTTNQSHIYLGTFVRGANRPVVNISTINNATSPTLTLDVVRSIGVVKHLPSVLLFYCPANTSTLMLRHSDDKYVSERQVADLNDNEFVVNSGMVAGRRLKVVTREAVGKRLYKTFLTSQGGLLLDSKGKPLWVSHHQRT